jgi:hypothetical protein
VGLGRQRRGTFRTEPRRRGHVAVTRRTAARKESGAFNAELRPGWSFVLALWTLHNNIAL